MIFHFFDTCTTFLLKNSSGIHKISPKNDKFFLFHQTLLKSLRDWPTSGPEIIKNSLSFINFQLFHTCTTYLLQNGTPDFTKRDLEQLFWSGALQVEPGRLGRPAERVGRARPARAGQPGRLVPPGRPVGCFAGGEGSESGGGGAPHRRRGAPPLLSPQVGYFV